MVTQEQKIEIDKFNVFIDIIEEITLFQKAFIKDVYYWDLKAGVYKYLEHFIEEKYSEILTLDEIRDEIQELITLGYIQKEVKRTIYNGKYSSYIIIKLIKQI